MSMLKKRGRLRKNQASIATSDASRSSSQSGDKEFPILPEVLNKSADPLNSGLSLIPFQVLKYTEDNF